ncbi:MAG: hypothetical protein V4475_08505 [Pseudomonadota bacterium]
MPLVGTIFRFSCRSFAAGGACHARRWRDISAPLREPLFSGTANPALAMIQFIATAVITTNVLSHGELTESAAARSPFSLLRCWEFPANSLPSPTDFA